MAGLRKILLSRFTCSVSQIEIIHNLPSQLRPRSRSRSRFQHVCCINTSAPCMSTKDNSDYIISPVYHNRNPRNLEKLAYARKRLGWKFQAPRKDFYHKLVLQRSTRHTKAWVEHFSGQVVLSASTAEEAISSQLNSLTDVSACENIGRVLAQRCLESGITEVFFDKADNSDISERITSFLKAFEDLEISLTEPEMIVPDYRPGVNYDGYNRYAEPKVWKEDYQDI